MRPRLEVSGNCGGDEKRRNLCLDELRSSKYLHEKKVSFRPSARSRDGLVESYTCRRRCRAGPPAQREGGVPARGWIILDGGIGLAQRGASGLEGGTGPEPDHVMGMTLSHDVALCLYAESSCTCLFSVKEKSVDSSPSRPAIGVTEDATQLEMPVLSTMNISDDEDMPEFPELTSTNLLV